MSIRQPLPSLCSTRRGSCLVSQPIRTSSQEIRDFISGVSGSIHLTFEEGTSAAWLYELIKPLVSELIVCDPRQNHFLKSGNKADRVNAVGLT